MIDINNTEDFLKKTFGSSIIYFDRYKQDLLFYEIDCLIGSDKKISVEVSSEFIKISCVDKKPSIDFSLHDYAFNNYEETKEYLLRIKNTGIYIPPPFQK